MEQGEINLNFELQQPIMLKLMEYPVSHKYLPGAPYELGDEYQLESTFSIQELEPTTYIKVKRLKDNYTEILAYRYFINK